MAEPEIVPNPNRLCSNPKCVHSRTQHAEDAGCRMCRCPGFYPLWLQEPEGIRIYRDPDDWWVGYYRGPKHHYVCLLPTVVIRWPRR